MGQRLEQAGSLWLRVLIVAWGAQAIITQSVVLRESLVLMFGSELAWGLVLFAWLAGVSIGGGIGGRLGARVRRADTALVISLLVLSAACCIDLWMFRHMRGWLRIAPGEILPLTTGALSALILITPLSAMVGLAFPFACRCLHDLQAGRSQTAGSLGSVYGWESFGSLIGGMVFTFWAVEHLSPVEILLWCAVVTMAGCTGLLAARGCGWRPVGSLAVSTAAALAVVILTGDQLNGWLVELRWRDLAPGYTLRREAESKYQNLAVCSRQEQFTLYCDGQVTTDFPDPFTYVPLTHFWMCQHPSVEQVLLLGGGEEGLLAEVLRHPVQHVDYIEPDAEQMAIVKPFLAEADRLALADPRVSVHHADARYFIKTKKNCYDLVIGRAPDPTSAMRARFYTTDFYGELRRAMKPQATYCMEATASPAGLTQSAATYLASIRAALKEHFEQVVVGWGTPAPFLATTSNGTLALTSEQMIRRYESRRIVSNRFDPLWFEGATDWLDPDKLKQRAEELDQVADPPVSTDWRPFIYVQRLILQGEMIEKADRHILERLADTRWPCWAGVLVLGAGATLMIYRLRDRSGRGWAKGAIGLSIGSTGFAVMALSIVWLFSFQNLYGYVYQRIGWIIALFMGGLVIGCWSIGHLRAQRSDGLRSWRGLIVVDVLLAVLAFSVPVVLPWLSAIQTSAGALRAVEWTISLMVIATGILGGGAFALAGSLQQVLTSDTAAAAGSIVAADHTGACLGALVTGICLVPILGIPATAMLLVGVKLGSAAVLATCTRAFPR